MGKHKSTDESDRNHSSPLEEVIEGARRRLQRAHSAFCCIAVALEYDGWTSRDPDYADAIDTANQLVEESLERLDIARLRPLLPDGDEEDSNTD
jgi:hypothetical protein